MKTSIILLFSLLIIMISKEKAKGVDSGNLTVGAGKICTNPPDSMFMSGVVYFDFPARDFIGIHDSLYVRSIVIENGITKAAMVSMDIAKVTLSEEELKSIARETGISREHLFISATHNHNTIELKGEKYVTHPYNRFLKDAIIKSIKVAESKLQPAYVGYAKGKAYVNTNRDEKIGEGYHMGYNPDGPSDKTVAVVSFFSLKGDPIAIYANYPVHAVTMYRAKTRDGHPEITGDLPGYTSKYVEDHFENSVVLWTSGAAGDQNPLFMANYNQDTPDVYDTGEGGYAILDVLSKRLGEEIVRLTNSIKNTNSNVQIWGKKTTITCLGRQRKTLADSNAPRGGYLAPLKIEMVDGDSVTIPLHLMMINDIALAGVCAEVFNEIGIHLKEQSIFDRTIMVTVMPPNVAGYIPTDEAYLLPSEKAVNNRLKPGYAEPAMINAFNEMMEEYIAYQK